jgi:hypothetical protein
MMTIYLRSIIPAVPSTKDSGMKVGYKKYSRNTTNDEKGKYSSVKMLLES